MTQRHNDLSQLRQVSGQYIHHVVRADIGATSDILSFYKEELAGEVTNFVHDRSKVTGQTVPEVLSGLLQEVVDSVNRARVLLTGEKEKAAWERFITGYTAFHFYSPRYKLIELTGTEYTNPNL